MKMVPNFSMIRDYAEAYMRGVLTEDEAIRGINMSLEANYFVPREEVIYNWKDRMSDEKIAPVLGRIEGKLDYILRMASGQEDASALPAFSGEALKLAQAGNAIGAVQLYRQQTGCGLAEAKAEMDRALGRINPPQGPAK